MSDFSIKSVVAGLLLALAALACGETLGLVFGANEEGVKAIFKERAAASESLTSSKKRKAAVGASWKYLKRSHEHFMGLGAVGVALITLIALSPVANILKVVVSTAVGAGSFLYPLFWLIAALQVASLGKAAGKESVAIVAQMGAGSAFLGLFGTIFIVLLWGMKKKES